MPQKIPSQHSEVGATTQPLNSLLVQWKPQELWCKSDSK